MISTKKPITTKQAIIKLMGRTKKSLTPLAVARKINRNPNTVRRCMRELYNKFELNTAVNGTYTRAVCFSM